MGPCRTGQRALANAEAVTALRVNMQLCQHVRSLEREVHDHTVLDSGDGIIARVNQEDWRCLLRNSHVRRERVLVGLHSRTRLSNKVAWINRTREIRAATYFVDLID